eukprot:COSAG01_NODE_50917_length_359_cov_0.742308_1_plen_41_part_01
MVRTVYHRTRNVRGYQSLTPVLVMTYNMWRVLKKRKGISVT